MADLPVTYTLNLTPGANKEESPSFCPDGRIVFSRLSDGQYDVWIMDDDGTDASNLTFNTPDSDDRNPDCSAAGIVFQSDRINEQFAIYTMDFDGTLLNQLTTTSGPDTDPSWLHTAGTYIVYVRDGQLRKMDRDGTDDMGLGVSGSQPEGSPDGQKIAYTCSGGICTIRPNGSGFFQVTTYTTDFLPHWNPRSNQLLFTRVDLGGHEGGAIWMIDANGSNLTPVIGPGPLGIDYLAGDWR